MPSRGATMRSSAMRPGPWNRITSSSVPQKKCWASAGGVADSTCQYEKALLNKVVDLLCCRWIASDVENGEGQKEYQENQHHPSENRHSCDAVRQVWQKV